MDALGDFCNGALRDYAEQATALVRLRSEIGSADAGEIAAEAAHRSRRKDERGWAEPRCLSAVRP